MVCKTCHLELDRQHRSALMIAQTQMSQIVIRQQASRRCLQALRCSGPYRYRSHFSSRRAERGPLAAGYGKNLGSCPPKNTHIHLLRSNLQLHSLHYHTPNKPHTATMAELTHPTIKDGKTSQSTHPIQWLAVKLFRRIRNSH